MRSIVPLCSQMAFVALVRVWAGGITLLMAPLRGSTETVMLHAPRRLTCLDLLLLSTPAALYAHRKGIAPIKYGSLRELVGDDI